jgi:hypothetical protein
MKSLPAIKDLMCFFHTYKEKHLFLKWAMCSVLLMWTCRTYAESFISRPPPDSEPTRVEIGVFILSLDSVATESQNFSARVYLEARWHDPRLAHDGNEIVKRPRAEVWNPRLQIANQQMLHPIFPDTVDILPTGEVIYRQAVWGSFSQPLNLREFPFDRQQLRIQIISVGSDTDEIAFIPLEETDGRKSGVATNICLPDWRVFDWQTKVEPYIPIESMKGIPGFLFSVNVGRHTTDFFLKVICPLIFIIAMSWVVFFIHPEEITTIVYIAGTAVFTLVIYLFTVNQMIPEASYITRMDKVLLMSMIAVFAGLMQTIVIVGHVKRGNTQFAQSIANWTRVLYPIIFLIAGIWILFF